MVWVDVEPSSIRPPRSLGKTDDFIRRHLRRTGRKVNAENVDVFASQVRVTQQQHESIQKSHKERADEGLQPHTHDEDGCIHEQARKHVQEGGKRPDEA